MRTIFQYRLVSTLILGLLVALGLGSKVYQGWGHLWVNDYSGDILYEIFWIWLIGFFKPQGKAILIATLVFLLTSVIEFSQLIPFPMVWKSNLVWRLLLGSHFAPWDFAHYALGCLIGGWSLHIWQKRFTLLHQTD